MLRVLLAKDLRRALRNPLPWLINLIVPLAMTALVGLVFGGHSDSGAMARVRFAVVDEDQSLLGRLLHGITLQPDAAQHLDPVFMERAPAMSEINAGKISAVLIIPAHFTSNYFTASNPVSLELIKNPAESINPAVLEELLGGVVTSLNATSHNLSPEFPKWRAALGNGKDYQKAIFSIERTGAELMTAPKYKIYLNPPLVTYEKEAPPAEPTNNAATKAAASKGDRSNPIFSYLLIGFSAMFLLFIAGSTNSDLYRELRQHTFERYQTLHDSITPFLAGKIVFAMVMLSLCSAIMLGGGALLFRVHWRHPVPLIAITLGYACFMAALFAVFVALMPDERHAALLNSLTGMALGLMGGVFPPEQLPAIVRDYITPLLPSYWFVIAGRNLQNGGDVSWGWVAFKLACLGAGLLLLAAVLFRRRFQTGLRS